MKAVALVPAAGSGTRLGGRQPKQYLVLGGAPLLVHTLRALARCPSIEGAVVAVSEDRIEATQSLLRRFRVPRVLAVVAGGEERQDSVRLGLGAVSSEAGWGIRRAAGRGRGEISVVG